MAAPLAEAPAVATLGRDVASDQNVEGSSPYRQPWQTAGTRYDVADATSTAKLPQACVGPQRSTVQNL